MIRFRLAELMDERDLTYQQVSEGAGVSTQTLYRLIKKTPKLVGTEVVARLCLFLDCTPNDLMEVTQHNPTQQDGL